MATLRRGLVDKVKKAASKVSARGVQVATKAGTRGARALVETTAAAVKTVDKLQQKLGRGASRARTPEKSPVVEPKSEATPRQPTPRVTAPSKATGAATKPRRVASERTPEAQPVELREAGRKTMPAAAPKSAKKASAPGNQFKVKRGQKHPHSGR